jgi:hypothetical protein
MPVWSRNLDKNVLIVNLFLKLSGASTSEVAGNVVVHSTVHFRRLMA